MSAFCDKTYPSLRDAFKHVKSNVALTVNVHPAFNGGASDVQSTFDAVKDKIAQMGIKVLASQTDKLDTAYIQVRATKAQIECLAKRSDVREFSIVS